MPSREFIMGTFMSKGKNIKIKEYKNKIINLGHSAYYAIQFLKLNYCSWVNFNGY